MISIHAPRVGSDYGFTRFVEPCSDFNPRSPCGERRKYLHIFFTKPNFNPRSPCGERLTKEIGPIGFGIISIHAPRVGSDIKTANTLFISIYFNPRSPCGERPTVLRNMVATCGFQSTLPVWGATLALYSLGQ